MGLRRSLLVVLCALVSLSLGTAPKAETGNASTAYERGDYRKAFQEFWRLAEQGDAAAQTSLGVMYDLGRGTLQNDREAVRWYHKAANQRHAAAQYNLAGMYRKGDGLPVDLVMAYAWYSLAAANSATDAERQQALHAREGCAKLLSPRELENAQEIAGLWLSDATAIGLVFPLSVPDEIEPDSITTFIQEGLATFGYDPGPADGIAGPKTHAAVRAFQNDHGLPVTGAISSDLAGEIVEQKARAGSSHTRASLTGPSHMVSLDPASTGPGIAVSREGHILTNYHLVEDCNEVRIAPDISADHVASDRRHDLALLKVDGAPAGTAIFRSGPGVRPGDAVVVAGLPKKSASIRRIDITTGTVRSLAGSGSNRRSVRVAANAQPSAVGGPILDLSSHVVGIAIGPANSDAAPKVNGHSTGSGFAIDARTAQPFLDLHDVPYESAPSAGSLAPSDVASLARRFMVVVECWN